MLANGHCAAGGSRLKIQLDALIGVACAVKGGR
jgi:hypothetical protein